MSRTQGEPTRLNAPSGRERPEGLKTSERFRVLLALNGHLTLDRKSGEKLIRIFEREEQVIEAKQILEGLIRDMNAKRQRENRILDQALMGCLWMSAGVIGMMMVFTI